MPWSVLVYWEQIKENLKKTGNEFSRETLEIEIMKAAKITKKETLERAIDNFIKVGYIEPAGNGSLRIKDVQG